MIICKECQFPLFWVVAVWPLKKCKHTPILSVLIDGFRIVMPLQPRWELRFFSITLVSYGKRKVAKRISKKTVNFLIEPVPPPPKNKWYFFSCGGLLIIFILFLRANLLKFIWLLLKTFITINKNLSHCFCALSSCRPRGAK